MTKPKRVSVQSNPLIPEGMLFTIEGCGIGAKGQAVFGGYNVKTRRKCKAVRLTRFIAGKTVSGG